MKVEALFPVDGFMTGHHREILNILSEQSPEYHLWERNASDSALETRGLECYRMEILGRSPVNGH